MLSFERFHTKIYAVGYVSKSRYSGAKTATFRKVAIFLIGFFPRRFNKRVINYCTIRFERGHMCEKQVILG